MELETSLGCGQKSAQNRQWSSTKCGKILRFSFPFFSVDILILVCLDEGRTYGPLFTSGGPRHWFVCCCETLFEKNGKKSLCPQWMINFPPYLYKNHFPLDLPWFSPSEFWNLGIPASNCLQSVPQKSLSVGSRSKVFVITLLLSYHLSLFSLANDLNNEFDEFKPCIISVLDVCLTNQLFRRVWCYCLHNFCIFT